LGKFDSSEPGGGINVPGFMPQAAKALDIRKQSVINKK
jgi:hypothetical protein